MNSEPEAHKRGLQLEDNGKFREAIEAFEELMDGDDELQFVSLLQRARILKNLGRFEEAVRLLRPASEMKPRDGLTTMALYYCLLNSGKFDDAIVEAKRFFEGRWDECQSDQVLEEHRKNVLGLLRMSKEDYSICRQKLMESAK